MVHPSAASQTWFVYGAGKPAGTRKQDRLPHKNVAVQGETSWWRLRRSSRWLRSRRWWKCW